MTNPTPTFSILTAGCKVNQYESERMRADLIRLGLVEVYLPHPADFYLVNTCTVTHIADRKSRQLVRRAAKTDSSARIIVTGCAVENIGALKGNLPAGIIFLGNEEKERIGEIIAPLLPYSHLEPGIIYAKKRRSRALLKIQDGCDEQCSYCIVPNVRGKSRSRSVAEIVKEASDLAWTGFREIVITGVHLGAYGRDVRFSLPELLETLTRCVSGTRFRLSSLEPADFSSRLLEVMVENPRICRHLHLSAQHASDRILESMNRGYTRAHLEGILRATMEAIPDIAISTDLIVGFPGEEKKDFDELYDFLDSSPICRFHVFKFSPRPGTPAARFPGQVPEELKDLRSEILITLGREKARCYQERFPGRILSVLLQEEHRPGLLDGISDNYLQVRARGDGELLGEIVPVRIERVEAGFLSGSVQLSASA